MQTAQGTFFPFAVQKIQNSTLKKNIPIIGTNRRILWAELFQKASCKAAKLQTAQGSYLCAKPIAFIVKDV